MTASKAVVGAVLAGLSTLVASLTALPGDADVTFRLWVVIVLGAVVSGLGVYAAPNRPGGLHKGQGGYGAIELAVGVILLLILVVVLFRLL